MPGTNLHGRSVSDKCRLKSTVCVARVGADLEYARRFKLRSVPHPMKECERLLLLESMLF